MSHNDQEGGSDAEGHRVTISLPGLLISLGVAWAWVSFNDGGPFLLTLAGLFGTMKVFEHTVGLAPVRYERVSADSSE